jgi:hypothetical protein
VIIRHGLQKCTSLELVIILCLLTLRAPLFPELHRVNSREALNGHSRSVPHFCRTKCAGWVALHLQCRISWSFGSLSEHLTNRAKLARRHVVHGPGIQHGDTFNGLRQARTRLQSALTGQHLQVLAKVANRRTGCDTANLPGGLETGDVSVSA